MPSLFEIWAKQFQKHPAPPQHVGGLSISLKSRKLAIKTTLRLHSSTPSSASPFALLAWSTVHISRFPSSIHPLSHRTFKRPFACPCQPFLVFKLFWHWQHASLQVLATQEAGMSVVHIRYSRIPALLSVQKLFCFLFGDDQAVEQTFDYVCSALSCAWSSRMYQLHPAAMQRIGCCQLQRFVGAFQDLVASAFILIFLQSAMAWGQQSSIHCNQFISSSAWIYTKHRIEHLCLVMTTSQEEQRLSLLCLSTMSFHPSTVLLARCSCSILSSRILSPQRSSFQLPR